MDAPDHSLTPPLINRELSLLEFNQRVLAQAQDASVPLLERLKFLCISSSNLDEFFEIRVAGIKQMLELPAEQQPRSPDGLDPSQQLAAIHRRATQLVADQYVCLTETLIPALREAGVHIVPRAEWDEPMRAWLAAFFEREVEPVLTPLALDPSRPFPRIQNKSLNFVVQLEGVDAYGREAGQAILQAPRSLPRVIPLPQLGRALPRGCEAGRVVGPGHDDTAQTGDALPDDGVLRRDAASAGGAVPQRFVALSAIVQEFVSRLFEGMRILGCYPFRVTRNSDLFVDEEEVDDLRHALEGELAQRRYGAAVRLETTRDCPDELVAFLLKQFSLSGLDLYRVPSMVNLHRLSAVYDLVHRLDLKFPAFSPGLPKRLMGAPDLFAVIRQRDVLLHHPYQPFSPVLDFLRQAAADPQVLAIKQTLYRTDADSAVVEALVAAAHSAKDVTVVIELRARFDEAANIELSNRLQEAGAHVMYGVVGYKTHAKMALVVRREAEGIRRYCHLGTGNYHSRTARGYTDYGLFTCDPEIGQDVHEIFLQLTSLTRTPRLSRLLQSPFGLHAAMLAKLDREAANAAAGRPARVILKMNSLVEPQAIEALYRASQAGVKVDLLVRGICALRPGVPGLSGNIRVRSIVGRFLEHSRVFCFDNGGDPEVFCSSADWMERNFFRRVEIAFPIRDAELRDRILQDLEICLRDDSQAWELGPDGRYIRLLPGGDAAVSAQAELLATYAAGSSTDD